MAVLAAVTHFSIPICSIIKMLSLLSMLTEYFMYVCHKLSHETVGTDGVVVVVGWFVGSLFVGWLVGWVGLVALTFMVSWLLS